MNTTTKTFPRSIAQAFNEDTSFAGPYRKAKPTPQQLLWVAISAAAVVVVGLDLFVWRP